MTAQDVRSPPATVRVSRRRRRAGELAVEAVAEAARRWRLIASLMGVNLKRTHADTVLGQLWWVLDPLLMMLVYVLLVGVIFDVGVPDYPLFIFAAILPWKWLSSTLGSATGSVTSRKALIRQVQFPKIVLPLAAVGSATVSFGIGLIALGLMYSVFPHRLSAWVLLLPIVAAVQVTFVLGLAIALSALNAFYRDIQNLLTHVVRLWFYASPALWSFREHLHEARELRAILQLNPMAPILESYRNVIYGLSEGGSVGPDFMGLAWVFALSIGVVIVGLVAFKRMEPAFPKVV